MIGADLIDLVLLAFAIPGGFVVGWFLHRTVRNIWRAFKQYKRDGY